VKTDRYRRINQNGFAIRELLVVVPAVVAVLLLGAFVASSVGHDAYIRWGGLTLNTAALFGFFINYSRQFFRQRQFWVLAAVLLALHLTAFAIVLTHVEEWQLMWFSVMVLEFPVLVFSRNRLLNPS
jgi:hypothetical protein